MHPLVAEVFLNSLLKRPFKIIIYYCIMMEDSEVFHVKFQ